MTKTNRTASDAARALRAIPSERRSEASRSNGARGGRPTTYALRSVKGSHGEITGTIAEARERAREVQAEMQAAYGVDVVRPDGHVVYTAQ